MRYDHRFAWRWRRFRLSGWDDRASRKPEEPPRQAFRIGWVTHGYSRELARLGIAPGKAFTLHLSPSEHTLISIRRNM